MDERTLLAGNAEQHGQRQRQAGLAHLAAGRDHFGRVRALVHGGKRCIVAALQPHVDDAQPQLPQGLEVIHALGAQVFCVRIDAHPLDPRQLLADAGEQVDQPRLRQDEGVAVAQEEPPGVGEMAGRVVDVRQHGGLVLEGEPLALVHAAEAALVVRAAGGHLQEDAARLARRPVDGALVVHVSRWVGFTL